SGYAILRLHGTGQLASRLAPSVWNTLSRSRLVHSKLLCRSDWLFKAGMAELADAADSKSAGLRPLGVRLPLPAPPQVPCAEAVSWTIFWRRRPRPGNSFKCRTDNIKRLDVRRPIQEFFENLHCFWIAAGVICPGISFVIPETDGCNFSGSGYSQGDQVEKAFLRSQPGEDLTLHESGKFGKRVRFQTGRNFASNQRQPPPVSPRRENRFPTVLPSRVSPFQQVRQLGIARACSLLLCRKGNARRWPAKEPELVYPARFPKLMKPPRCMCRLGGNLLEVWEKGNETVPEFELTS